MGSDRISPTAHYTGMVWARNGLSHPTLSRALSPALYWAASPIVWATAPLAGGITLDEALLQRHRIVDALLTRAIEEAGVVQVVEIAAGMSARGLRLCAAYPQLRYIEGDLPAMAARKARATDGVRRAGHTVLAVDALAPSGPGSLAGLLGGHLDPGLPTAVVAEGLGVYLDHASLSALWARIGEFLGNFPRGVFITDLITDDLAQNVPPIAWFFRLVGLVARGRVQTHFADGAAATAMLTGLGYSRSTLHSSAAWRSVIGVPVGSRGDLQYFVEAWRGGEGPLPAQPPA